MNWSKERGRRVETGGRSVCGGEWRVWHGAMSVWTNSQQHHALRRYYNRLALRFVPVLLHLYWGTRREIWSCCNIKVACTNQPMIPIVCRVYTLRYELHFRFCYSPSHFKHSIKIWLMLGQLMAVVWGSSNADPENLYSRTLAYCYEILSWITITVFTITTFIFSHSFSFSLFWTEDLALW